MPPKPNYRALVEIELHCPGDEQAVDDLIHETWQAGDPPDATNATIIVSEVVALDG